MVSGGGDGGALEVGREQGRKEGRSDGGGFYSRDIWRGRGIFNLGLVKIHLIKSGT